MGIATVCIMFLVVLVAFAVSRWDKRAAYQLIAHGQHLFEPEAGDGPALPSISSGGEPNVTKRKHFSPLVSKQIAARQQFRCALCRRLFDDQLWDLDHIVPLFRGGGNELSNIRAICRACHMDLSARQQAR
jgi:5-methylcytosine-specific restriction protein A